MEILCSVVRSEGQIFLQEAAGDLAHSIREKLMILPDETKLYPGHMDESTIGYEKEINPFI